MRKQTLLPLFAALAFATTAQAASTPIPTAPAPSPQMAVGVVGAPIGVRPRDFDAETVIAPPGTETVIGVNGERIAVDTVASVLPAPTASTPTLQLSAAERAAQQRIQAKTARKQQLMHSITPRTKNDRTDQMPDDPNVVP